MGLIMKQYKVPIVGDVITVLTRYKSHYRYDDKDYDEHTYTDVSVMPRFEWMTDDEFRVKDIRMCGPHIVMDRIIKIRNVVEMTGEKITVIEDSRTVLVSSQRTGEVYQVSVENGRGIKCTCKGFHFRQRCSHLKKAVEA